MNSGPLLRSCAIGPLLVVGLLLFAAACRLAAWLRRAGYPRTARGVILLFGPISVLFNVVAGTVIWLDAPRELTFTDRVARKYAEGDTCAWQIRSYLLKVDPAHFSV